MHLPPRLTAAVLDRSYSHRVSAVAAVLAQGAVVVQAPEQAVVAVPPEPRAGLAVAPARGLEVGRGPVAQAQVRAVQVRVAEVAPALAAQLAAVQEGLGAEARAGPGLVPEEAIHRLVSVRQGVDLTAAFRAMTVRMVTVFPAGVSTLCPDGRNGKRCPGRPVSLLDPQQDGTYADGV